MRPMAPRRLYLLAVLLAAAGLLVGSEASRAGGGCGPAGDSGGSTDPTAERFVPVEGMELVCYPAQIQAPEGKWTFLLRGRDALSVTGAVLQVSGAEYPVKRVSWPTPRAALLDFEYPPLAKGTSAQLVLRGGDGAELARLSIKVAGGVTIRPERRQKALVRVQLRPWVFRVYPLHGFPRDGGVKERPLAWIDCEDEFRSVLQDMGVERVRKVLSRYAEDDSVRWDPRLQRELIYKDAQLRQYIMYLDPDRSEAAYKEILLGFDQVEGVYINEDRSHRRRPPQPASR